MTSTCKSKGGLFLENYVIVIHQLSLLMIVTDVKLSRLRPTGKTKELLSFHLKMDLKSERASILESVLGLQTETKT